MPHTQRIVSLFEHPHCLTPLARLHHEEWSTVSPFKTVEQHVGKLEARVGRDPVPATYVLLVDDDVAGSVSLLGQDDIAGVRPDLSPWLASLVVDREHRRRGYGSALVARCVGEARALGFPALYLHTQTHPRFYARMGWRTIEERTEPGAILTVMEKVLVEEG